MRYRAIAQVFGLVEINLQCRGQRILTVLLQQLHAAQSVHRFNEIHVFDVLYVHVEKYAVLIAEFMNVITEPHPRPVGIRGGYVDSPQRTPFLKDLRDERLARCICVILGEPFNR